MYAHYLEFACVSEKLIIFIDGMSSGTAGWLIPLPDLYVSEPITD